MFLYSIVGNSVGGINKNTEHRRGNKNFGDNKNFKNRYS